MAKDKIKTDLVGKSDDQLNESLVDLKREAFNLRFPGGDQPAREAQPRARGPSRHRPYQDPAGAAHQRRAGQVKEAGPCPSAC